MEQVLILVTAVFNLMIAVTNLFTAWLKSRKKKKNPHSGK